MGWSRPEIQTSSWMVISGACLTRHCQPDVPTFEPSHAQPQPFMPPCVPSCDLGIVTTPCQRQLPWFPPGTQGYGVPRDRCRRGGRSLCPEGSQDERGNQSAVGPRSLPLSYGRGRGAPRPCSPPHTPAIEAHQPARVRSTRASGSTPGRSRSPRASTAAAPLFRPLSRTNTEAPLPLFRVARRTATTPADPAE